MRWDSLFADLEGQWEAAEAADLSAEVAERARLEAARLRLLDRLAANVGAAATCRLVNGDVVVGEITSYGPDWVLVVDETSRSVLLPVAALVRISGLGRLSADPSRQSRVESKLDLRYALRRLVRDRGDVLISFVDGTRITGSLVRAGADFVEVSESSPRDDAVRRAVHTIPLRALVFVRPA